MNHDPLSKGKQPKLSPREPQTTVIVRNPHYHITPMVEMWLETKIPNYIFITELLFLFY